jgi:hypothetical protein
VDSAKHKILACTNFHLKLALKPLVRAYPKPFTLIWTTTTCTKHNHKRRCKQPIWEEKSKACTEIKSHYEYHSAKTLLFLLSFLNCATTPYPEPVYYASPNVIFVASVQAIMNSWYTDCSTIFKWLRFGFIDRKIKTCINVFFNYYQHSGTLISNNFNFSTLKNPNTTIIWPRRS